MSKFAEMFYNISKERTSENEANPVDTVTMDVPLLIRMFEYAREDANTDMDLHDIAEKLIALSTNNETLTMDVYSTIVNTDETDNKELSEGSMKKREIIINEEVQYDAHGFATVHRDGKFYLIFNDEVVGKYDTMQELKDAHEHVINKIKLPEELEEGTDTEWEIIINGNSYTTAVGETQEEAITNFWKANVEKEGIERFLGDMLYAQELKTNESVTESLDDDMEAMLRIAGLR